MTTPLSCIDQFYAAITAKNAPLICTHYVPDEDTYVVLEGPRLTTRGYAKIAKGWDDFCQSGLSLSRIEWLEGPFEETSTDMAWIGGIIRLTIELKGKEFERVFRATFVLRWHDGGWRIRHEHVSAALEDPYGIGDWLKIQK